jgi:taurine dehydrogenase small subunit
MTPEEQLIHRYFEAFNRHDVEGVMACFHDDPVATDAEGHRLTGREEVRRAYETSFARYPDGHCDLRTCIGNDGRAMAESFFRGTQPREGQVVEAIGAEVLEIRDGKIKEIRDYHHYFPAKVA